MYRNIIPSLYLDIFFGSRLSSEDSKTEQYIETIYHPYILIFFWQQVYLRRFQNSVMKILGRYPYYQTEIAHGVPPFLHTYCLTGI
jgi:hypothetical protein